MLRLYLCGGGLSCSPLLDGWAEGADRKEIPSCLKHLFALVFILDLNYCAIFKSVLGSFYNLQFAADV